MKRVKKPQESKEARFMRRLITKRYTIALVAIAILITANYSLLKSTIKSQQSDATVINISGRQRMLSQQTALLVSQMVSADTDREREQARQQLKVSISTFARSHKALLQGDAQLNIPAEKSAMTRNMYQSPPLDLHSQVQTYVNHVQAILAEDLGVLSQSNPHYNYIMAAANGRLLESLDTMVKHYEAENLAKVEYLNGLETVIYAITLLALLLEVIFIFHPLTKQIGNVQQRLEHVNKVKSAFLANMSHEIRTPMNSVFGMGELLQQSPQNADQQRYTNTLLSAADDLLSIIDDVLDYAKIEAGKLGIEPTTFDLQATLEDVVDLMADKATEKQLDLMVRYLPGTPRFVVGDPARIRQIVTKLVDNALKFTQDGHVLIQAEVMLAKQTNARKRKDIADNTITLKISVKDTGIGIPQDKQELIFDKFQQADISSTREYGGAGLGLTISKQLVDLMDGEITVDSEPGDGATFYFTIQLQRADVTLEEPTPASLHNLKVLVVDDIADNRLLLNEQLSAAGMVPHLAASGREALQLLEEAARQHRPFDIVVADYMMPCLDGEQLTRKIRSTPDIAQTPVVILSSAGEGGFNSRFSEAGVSAYSAKPVRQELLLDILSQVWGKHQRGETAWPLPAPEPVMAAPLPSSSARAPAAPILPDPLATMQQVETVIDQVALNALDAAIDMAAINDVKALMGAKFSKMMQYYLEDCTANIAQIHESIKARNLKALCVAAHSVKSSSMQFGVTTVAEYGAQIESSVRAAMLANDNTVPGSVNVVLPKLEAAFTNAQPTLQQMVG